MIPFPRLLPLQYLMAKMVNSKASLDQKHLHSSQKLLSIRSQVTFITAPLEIDSSAGSSLRTLFSTKQDTLKQLDIFHLNQVAKSLSFSPGRVFFYSFFTFSPFALGNRKKFCFNLPLFFFNFVPDAFSTHNSKALNYHLIFSDL